MNRNKVVVSGANGFVGRNVSSFLAANGFEIISLVRKKGASVGSTIITSDLTEKDLAGKIKGSAAFMHFVGTGRQTTESDYETVNVNLTKNAILLCKRSKIQKIIYLSGLGVDKKSTLGYFVSKFKAEQEVTKSGLDYTIFRPSYIVGRGDPLSNILSSQVSRGSVIIPGSGRYRLQPIYVYDAAQVIMRAIHGKQFSKKIIDLVGPQTVTYNKFVCDLVGNTKTRHVDFEKMYHDSLRSPDSPFGVDDLGILVGDYTGDHKRLERISKVSFTRYTEMLEACRLS
ncbi:MAG: NAD(P)H-binding protein [Thaumarchaeota archaeon]|nr:NAD(P)H-binding protein [Nitrososphaerota archaeon]